MVDPKRIILFGHSEGGLIAAIAGEHVNAQKVVMLASPAMAIESLLHEQARSISAEYGATTAQIDHEHRMNTQVFALSKSHLDPLVVVSEIEKVIASHLRTWPDMPFMDEASINENARVMAEVVSSPAYRTLLRQDPSEIINRFPGPILAIYGGKDLQVPGLPNMDAFLRITSERDNTTVRFFPDHNHLFQLAVTGSISEYENLLPAPDTKILREVTAWLESSEPSDGPKSRAGR
jgi:pimeloyl-ACP methyl ester carboxylesterase